MSNSSAVGGAAVAPKAGGRNKCAYIKMAMKVRWQELTMLMLQVTAEGAYGEATPCQVARTAQNPSQPAVM